MHLADTGHLQAHQGPPLGRSCNETTTPYQNLFVDGGPGANTLNVIDQGGAVAEQIFPTSANSGLVVLTYAGPGGKFFNEVAFQNFLIAGGVIFHNAPNAL